MKRLTLWFLLLLLALAPDPVWAAYQAIGKAEDAVHGDGDIGVMSLCVRKDTSTTGMGANGDYVPCAVNASGELYTTSSITAMVPGTGASSLGKAEDAAHGTGDTGVMGLCVREAASTDLSALGTDGDYEPCQVDAVGRLWVNPAVIGVEDAAETAGGNLAMAGTVRRDTAASSAGTTGDNATLNTDATGRLWSNTELPDAAALADDTANPTIPGVAAFLMCWDSTGSNWDRCLSSSNYLEDAASAGGEQVILAGGVRQDTLASNTSLDGDYTYNKYTAAGRLYTSAAIDTALPAGTNNIGDVDAIQSGTWTVQPGNTANTTPWLATISQGGNAAVVNGSGQLSITCANCSGSGASFVDDAAFTVGTSSGAPAMGLLDETVPDSVDEGDVGTVRMSANRNLYVRIRDNAGNERGLNIDASGALAAVATNAGTFAVQESGAALTALQLIDNIVHTEDEASADGHSGALILARRNNIPANTSGADGDYEALQLFNGRLWATAAIDSCVGCGGEYTHDAAITPGTTVGQMAMGRASATAPADVTADNDAVLPWYLRSGAQVGVQFFSGGNFAVSGNGTVDPGVQRITIASDSTGQLAITNAASFDFDSGAGTDTTPALGIAVAASGGAAAITGDVTNGLDVDVTRVSGNVTVVQGTGTNLHTVVDSCTGCGGGTQYAVDAVAGAADTGTLALAVRDDALATLTPVDGDYTQLRVDSTGSQWVHVSAIDAGTITTVSTVTSLSQFAGAAINLGAGTIGTGTLRLTIATDDPVNDYAVKMDANLVAHDAVDAGNPLKIGGRAIAHSANPTAVAAGDRTDWLFNRAGVPFVIGGHPNVITTTALVVDATGGQTDAAIVTVGAGTKIVVTRASAKCDADNTVNVNIKAGFGATTLPADSATGAAGILTHHPDVAPGGGFVEGSGSGILGIGGDGEDLRQTVDDTVGGSCAITYSYYTIES